MNFFKKFFTKQQPSKESEPEQPQKELSLDECFVQKFIEKGGKFLYCTQEEEISDNLLNILQENNWKSVTSFDDSLLKFTSKKDIHFNNDITNESPFFTSCEHLIADVGNILFSSNQIKDNKIHTLPPDFIVYATTSQLVKNMGQGLTGIKTNCKDKLPTNISAIKNYALSENDDNFMNYGNSNSKNLYLLLFEDL